MYKWAANCKVDITYIDEISTMWPYQSLFTERFRFFI